jgi:hypothetical protein
MTCIFLSLHIFICENQTQNGIDTDEYVHVCIIQQFAPVKLIGVYGIEGIRFWVEVPLQCICPMK